jgi:hypothetical protein
MFLGFLIAFIFFYPKLVFIFKNYPNRAEVEASKNAAYVNTYPTEK